MISGYEYITLRTDTSRVYFHAVIPVVAPSHNQATLNALGVPPPLLFVQNTELKVHVWEPVGVSHFVIKTDSKTSEFPLHPVKDRNLLILWKQAT